MSLDAGLRSRISRKFIVVIIVLAVISCSGFYIWYEYYRHWSVEDLEDAVITWEYDSMSSVGIDLGFKTYLEGRTVTVEDRIEDIRSMDTTIGQMNLISLRGGEFVQLVKWGALDFGEGDKIKMDVTFERGVINGAEHVFSPQVGFPGYGIFASCQVQNQAVSWVNGGGWVVNVEDHGNDVVIRIDRSPDPVMLEIAKCSIKAGMNTGVIEYLDINGLYPNTPDLDTVLNLGIAEGQNGTMEFVDENEDGFLDEGDVFIIRNLTHPETASGAQTYLLRVDRETYPDERSWDSQWPNVFCAYLIMTDRGVLWTTSTDTPIGAAFISMSEEGIAIVADYISEPVSWNDVEFLVSDGTSHDRCSPDWNLLGNGTVSSCSCGILDIGGLRLECRVTDMEGNGLLEAKDRIELIPSDETGFSETQTLTCTVVYMPKGTSIMWKTYTRGLEPTSECEVLTGDDSASITLGPIYNGSDVSYVRVDVPWDHITVFLSDGENLAEWHLAYDDLDDGTAMSWTSGDTNLGNLSVACAVRDLQGNGLANTGDSIDVTVLDGETFGTVTEYELSLEHIPTGVDIFSTTFTG